MDAFEYKCAQCGRRAHDLSAKCVHCGALFNHPGSKVRATRMCTYCDGEITTTARKCKHCGEWLRDEPVVPTPAAPRPPLERPQYSEPVRATPAAVPAPVVTVVPPAPPESVAFAVVTLLFYIFLFPVGLILNVVGLLTGPRRGCFFSLLLLFVVVPIAAAIAIGTAGARVGIDAIDKAIQYFDLGPGRRRSGYIPKSPDVAVSSAAPTESSSPAGTSARSEVPYWVTYPRHDTRAVYGVGQARYGSASSFAAAKQRALSDARAKLEREMERAVSRGVNNFRKSGGSVERSDGQYPAVVVERCIGYAVEDSADTTYDTVYVLMKVDTGHLIRTARTLYGIADHQEKLFANNMELGGYGINYR